MCISTLRDSFDCDPLSLGSFLNSIDFVEKRAANADQRTILKDFIKTKLKGKSLEVIPETENATIAEIKKSLKDNFRPETSAVIEGKLLALKIHNSNVQDFSKQVEELSDALERSFRAEGIPQEKSKQMTIQRTVDLCRTTARSDTVKAIIAATPFKDTKEVVAKFIVETSKDKQEKQILTLKANTRSNNNNNRNNNRFNNRNNNNSNNNYRRNGNNYNNNNYNNNNYNNNRNNGFRNNNFNNRSNNNHRPRTFFNQNRIHH